MKGYMQNAQHGPWHILGAKKGSNIRRSSSSSNINNSHSHQDIIVLRHFKWPAVLSCLGSLPAPQSLYVKN